MIEGDSCCIVFSFNFKLQLTYFIYFRLFVLATSTKLRTRTGRAAVPLSAHWRQQRVEPRSLPAFGLLHHSPFTFAIGCSKANKVRRRRRRRQDLFFILQYLLHLQLNYLIPSACFSHRPSAHNDSRRCRCRHNAAPLMPLMMLPSMKPPLM